MCINNCKIIYIYVILGQTYSNNRVPMHYQFIDAESNVVEHNSSGCKNIKAASSSVKIGKITSNTSKY